MIKNLKYINIEYTNDDLEYIDHICDEIERKSEDIVNFFEINDFNERVNIKLFDNIDNFRNFYEETYHREPKDWVCGFAKDNNVYTLSLSEYRKCLSHENSTIEDLERLILHEFTHAVHLKRHNNITVKWISEGAATYLSGQHKDKKEITCTYEELINNAPYYNYKIMFEYVFNTYGKDYILKLIDNEELLNKETKRLFEEIKHYKGGDIMDNVKVTDLETERLILKIPTMKEQYDLWNIFKEKEVNEWYMPLPKRYEEYYKLTDNTYETAKERVKYREDFQEKIQDWDKQKEYYQKKIDNLDNNSNKFSWSIFLKDGEVIGQISVQPNSEYEDNPKIRDIGWFINPKYQGQGFATEAATKVLEFMFNEAKIDEIKTSAAKLNLPSWHLMEKLGFVRTGEKTGTYIDDEGFLIPNYTYEITKEMYFENNKGMTL